MIVLELKRLWHGLGYIRMVGFVRAWKRYILVHQLYPYRERKK